MSYPIDPIRTWRRRGTRLAAAGAALLTLACAWALWPASRPDLDAFPQDALAESPRTGSPAAPTTSPLEPSIFQVRLWNAPPAPIDETLAAASEPPPPPPKLELIAIITQGQRRSAALYDIGADRLHVVVEGERIGSALVLAVTASEVQLRDGARTYRLAISPTPVEPAGRLSSAEGGEARP